MTADDFQRIESELSLTLPESYKRFMADYPPALRKVAITTETDDESYTERPADMELPDSAEAIIGMNKSNPAEYEYDIRPDDWPATYLVIGQNGCGDVYGIDTAVEDSPVYMGGPHLGEYDRGGIAVSLAAFAEHLVEQYRRLS